MRMSWLEYLGGSRVKLEVMPGKFEMNSRRLIKNYLKIFRECIKRISPQLIPMKCILLLVFFQIFFLMNCLWLKKTFKVLMTLMRKECPDEMCINTHIFYMSDIKSNREMIINAKKVINTKKCIFLEF